MANYTDFEGCISEGVSVNQGARNANYIEGISKVNSTLETMKENNYYQNDSGTIDQSISMVQGLKSALESTGIFFQYYPEYRTKFDTVIGEMQTFKTNKTKINPKTFTYMLKTYNNDLYGAKVAYDGQALSKEIKSYNQNPIKLTERYTRDDVIGRRHFRETKTFTFYDKASNGGIKRKTGTVVGSDWQKIQGTEKMDKIVDSSSQRPIESYTCISYNDIAPVESYFGWAKYSLNYRQLKLGIELPKKPTND